MYGNEFLDALTGKQIIGIDVSDNEESLRFRCAEGNVVWETYGDCCSQSWWADGFQLNSLRGGAVRSVGTIEIPGPVDDSRSRQEYDSVYGIEIVTHQGKAQLVFRNSSNGYYGGWCGLGTDDDRHEWREITGNDWSA